MFWLHAGAALGAKLHHIAVVLDDKVAGWTMAGGAAPHLRGGGLEVERSFSLMLGTLRMQVGFVQGWCGRNAACTCRDGLRL